MYMCQPHRTAQQKHSPLTQAQRAPVVSSCSPLWLMRMKVYYCKIHMCIYAMRIPPAAGFRQSAVPGSQYPQSLAPGGMRPQCHSPILAFSADPFPFSSLTHTHAVGGLDTAHRNGPICFCTPVLSHRESLMHTQMGLSGGPRHQCHYSSGPGLTYAYPDPPRTGAICVIAARDMPGSQATSPTFQQAQHALH